MPAQASFHSRPQDRVAAYLSSTEHRCPGCRHSFRGETAFLEFVRHVDRSVSCRYEFEMYLDAVRADAGGS